mmetsp:Transcript_23894/g.56276  ORF Transcript_23894/g.56276 Transcript_23894/m.56276 type:complete len:167 (-) Transcript_23894:146-646(-)
MSSHAKKSNYHSRQLDKIRKLPENRRCADCGGHGTVWASVNLGVFLCMNCGARHRGLGTHITLPKGCTGTYLWGPDEIHQMMAMGNERAKQIYGADDHRPKEGASDVEWLTFLREKYELTKFAPRDGVRIPDQGIEGSIGSSKCDFAHTMTSTGTQEHSFFAEFGL